MTYRFSLSPDRGVSVLPSWLSSDYALYNGGVSVTRNRFGFVQVGEVAFSWQPIVNIRDSRILYYECLARSVDRDGRLHSMANAIGALERLGLIRSFDSRIVSMALDELAAHPVIELGVNISAHSAMLDSWWDHHRTRLNARPDLASRLVIEITETAPLASMKDVKPFMAVLRQLGCRFALNDFGAGHASFRQLMALSPDIVKISSAFLHAGSGGRQKGGALAHLAGLADVFAPTVVVNGIETEAQSRMARELGLIWQQGYLLGSPSQTRFWRNIGTHCPTGIGQEP